MRTHARALFMIILVGLVALILAPCVGQDDTEPQDVVKEIEIRGNASVSKFSIQTALESAGVKTGASVTAEVLAMARDAVMAMGTFVDVEIVAERIEGGVRVICTVYERPVVKEIRVAGATLIPPEDILAILATKTGSVLHQSLLDADARAIQDLYIESGGWYAFLSDAPVDADGVLTLVITEVRVEDVQYEGLTKTKPYVLRREMTLIPGDFLNIDKLIRDRDRIYNLGFFESVEYDIDFGGMQGDLSKCIVIFIVAEQRTGELLLGAAYSSTTRWLGRIQVSESNLGGTGKGVNLLAEVGEFGGGSSWEVGYYHPWVDKKATSASFSVFNKLVYRFSSTLPFGGGATATETRYSERRAGASTVWTRPIREDFRVSVGLRGETVTTKQIEGYEAPPIDIQQDGRIFTTSLTGVRDTRDYYTDPSRGVYQSGNIEFGFADIRGEGDSNYIKYVAEMRKYKTLGGPPKTRPDDPVKVLAARLIVGLGSGDMPFFEQYFVGGSDSLRGYKEDRFWGTSMFLGSVEYRAPVTKQLQAVLFADVGGAWGSPEAGLSTEEYKQDEKFRAHVGYGAGIRVRTPLGPLRIDYGFGTEGSRAHFSLGHVF